MILFCVRHGQTVFNASGRIQGQLDSELSDLGRLQCRAVAEALAAQRIQAVYSSPLKRALDSARAIADRLQLSVQVDPRLMEINAGIFQGLDWPDIDVRYPHEAARWKSADPDYRIPTGESRRDVMHRAQQAFEAIRETGSAMVVVVAHGGLLSAAFKALLGIDARRNPFSLANASISQLLWEREVKLLSLNRADHLLGLEGSGGEL